MKFLSPIQRITLYLFFFSINFEMLSLGGGNNFSVSKIFGILYIISILPQYQMFIRTDSVKYYLMPIALYFGLYTFMGIFNINEYTSSFFDLAIFLNIILFWNIINHERKDYLILEKGMLSFALGSTALVLCFYLGIGVIYDAGRLSMFGDDQNYIGFRTSIGILILVLAVVQNRLKLGWYRYLLLLPIPLMINMLFETGSRGAFIVFVLSFGGGILLFKTKRVWGKLAVFAAGIATLILAGIILMQSETMVERLVLTVETGDTAGRTEIWQALLPIIKKNPFFGIGHTGYLYESTIIYGQETGTHNVILEILCYTGIVGLIIYLIFLYRIGITSYISYNKHNILLPLLLLIPLAGMILSLQILSKKIVWVIFAYIISSLAKKRYPITLKNETH